MKPSDAFARPGGSWIGQRLLRREDPRLLTGQGRYVDDLAPEGCLHLVFVRAEEAHARLLEVETQAARAAPGVVAVFTAGDLHLQGHAAVNLLVEDVTPVPLEVLAQGTVRALGQPVAAVVAMSRDAARDAAELVSMTLAPLPIPQGEDRPVVMRAAWTGGDVDAAFAAAAATVSVTCRHALVAPFPMEPRAALADGRGDTLTAWFSTQTPHRAREDLARILGRSLGTIRVIAPDVGGAFGGKASIYPEDVMVAWAAARLRAPVKWCATRSEDLLSATQGRGAVNRAELALSADGILTGLRARLDYPQGAWMPYSAVVPARNAGRILPGPYLLETVDIAARGLQDHRAAVGIYRGAGRPEAAMLMERLMDEAARALALDPLELRRRNIIPPARFPHRSATGETLDSADLAGLLDTLERETGYPALKAQVSARRAAGEAVGLGLSLYVEPCGQGWESATLGLMPDGSFTATTGSSAQGQGRETAISQIVAETLGVDAGAVTVLHGDTETTPNGTGALASRSTAIGGSAMLRAARALGAQVRAAAARALGVPEAAVTLGPDGVSAPGARLGWEAFAARLPAPAAPLPGGAVLHVSETYTAAGEAWSSGACLAVVRIDADTGVPAVERLAWVDDAGVVLNPMLVQGQLEGGMAQGLGEALMEGLVYDGEGQLLTGSLMDYALPRAADVPAVALFKQETPAPNPIGAKGVGEAGCIGIPAALFNAVRDALGPDRGRDLQMPLTPERLWRALAEEPAPEPTTRQR
ncbi:xanthine dehydrogenase family protein molybdopterin-binding subunit (plasmid) [Paroceanicella profunda]|uniref:Xanthine dehydrogenase family protein molybdopterin-binding subunit n=1 Tax=Paroceanicella profunda TaxID=2579971 RepID=A0A5B8G1V0_9RHOB|nr:xanthine dehydrogenase family protein molybdopterin-binding subunit [Paroceanicella profunda]QDL94024.1 xanthine dehydrogenase family protein molybdopterin-binding subunit [Paroceanicella profunda]